MVPYSFSLIFRDFVEFLFFPPNLDLCTRKINILKTAIASKSNANLKPVSCPQFYYNFGFFLSISLIQKPKPYLPYFSSPITYQTEFDNVQIIVIYSIASIKNYCVLPPLSPDDDYFILYYDPAIHNSRSWEKFMQFDEKL